MSGELRIVFSLAVAMAIAVTAAVQQASAAGCDRCGRVWHAGDARPADATKQILVCRACFVRMRHGWQTVSTSRYAMFADGTLIDWKHVRASMLVSHAAGMATEAASCGVVFANLAGWGVEWMQYSQGSPGGRPLGGNEDLYSNFAGSLLGQLTASGGVPCGWVKAAITMLEWRHGTLQFVSDRKP